MRLEIDIWTDYLCPYCFVTARSLNALKTRHPVKIHYHMFELKREQPVASLDKRRTLIDILQPPFEVRAEREFGLTINQGPRDINSRAALVATKVAAANGKAHPFFQRVMTAYWQEGKPINKTSVLAQCATDVGLDAYDFVAALKSPIYAAAVAADISQAHQRRVEHVPTLVIGGKLELTGAQPYEALESAVIEMLATSGK